MENIYKIVVFGGGGVGKSSLVLQYVEGNALFLNQYDPTIEDSFRKRVKIDNENYILDILDTAGQDEFSALRDQYNRIADGYILVYSITSRPTFDEIDEFRDRIFRVRDCDRVPMILVGNKRDLDSDRKVSFKEGFEKASRLGGIPFIETSAKDFVNVDEIFSEIVRVIRSGIYQPVNRSKAKNKRGNCQLL